MIDHDPATSVAGILALVLSNVLFLPLAIFAYKCRFYIPAATYLAVFFNSSLYHACKPANGWCILPFPLMFNGDFMFAFLTVPITLSYFIAFAPLKTAPARVQYMYSHSAPVEMLVFLLFAQASAWLVGITWPSANPVASWFTFFLGVLVLVLLAYSYLLATLTDTYRLAATATTSPTTTTRTVSVDARGPMTVHDRELTASSTLDVGLYGLEGIIFVAYAQLVTMLLVLDLTNIIGYSIITTVSILVTGGLLALLWFQYRIRPMLTWPFLVVGLSLLFLGAGLFLGQEYAEGPELYAAIHSPWHLLSAIGQLFLILMRLRLDVRRPPSPRNGKTGEQEEEAHYVAIRKRILESRSPYMVSMV